MINLKHFQLYEAFESKILSKTLGFIRDKGPFIDILKKICQTIDYPISDLSDEFFEYLPFKSALYKSAETIDEPCDAESEIYFPEYSVAGAKCEKGKLKRKWGEGVREVTCPKCDGTGLKPKKSELKLIKFWFNIDRKLITTTLVDGVIRKHYDTSEAPDIDNKVSLNLEDYRLGQVVRNVNILSGGEVVRITSRRHGQSTNFAAYIYMDQGRIYAIHDMSRFRSYYPPGGDGWKFYGAYAIQLTNHQFTAVRLLIPKIEDKKPKKKKEINPYTWNVGLNYNYGRLSANPSVDVKELIKNAHFAIIFDYDKLLKSEYKKVQISRVERAAAKFRSKLDAEQSDEAIRRANIERYINKLSQNLDISKDIGNCNKLVNRVIGPNFSFYTIYATNIYNNLTTIIGWYLAFMKCEADYKIYWSNKISEYSAELYRSSVNKNNLIDRNIKEIKDRLKSQNREERYFKIFNDIDNLSRIIYENLRNFQIDNIEDFEVVIQKISSIRNILKSDRYDLGRFLSYVIENIVSNNVNRAYNNLVDSYYTDFDTIFENLPKVTRIISKL